MPRSANPFGLHGLTGPFFAVSGGGAPQARVRCHRTKVTAILTLKTGELVASARTEGGMGEPIRGVGACYYFASASSEGEVAFWSLHSMRPIHRFQEHSGVITSLLQPPQGVPPHMERWALAVGADGCISIYDLGELLPPSSVAANGGWRHSDGRVSCLVVLNGHSDPVREWTF